MASRACPACGSWTSRLAWAVDGYEHARCGECGTVFVDPVPPSEALHAFYSRQSYYDNARRDEARLRAQATVRAGRLHRMGASRVLDVGCAAGYFLDAARAAGMRGEGVEPGPAGQEALVRGHTVHAHWLGEPIAAGGSFDAVTLWEVIEHLVDPLAALRQVTGSLRPRGIVALSTPSMSGLAARLLGRRFPMVLPPEHLALFTAVGLHRLLRRASLRVIRWSSFSELRPEQLERGLLSYAPPAVSSLAASIVRLLGPLSVAPVEMLDRLGLGTEVEVFALHEGSVVARG